VIISLIVSMDEKGGIGKENRLPWRQSSDLKRFKALTMGHHLIMGRKTYESIGKPLPGRTTIVVTRNPTFQVEGGLIAHSLGEALALARAREEEEAFIIGGSLIFSQAIGIADRIYLTLIHAQVEADVFFPQYDQGKWKAVEAESHPADDNNQYPYTFMVLIANILDQEA
jgi:dihydrofolate reductase